MMFTSVNGSYGRGTFGSSSDSIDKHSSTEWSATDRLGFQISGGFSKTDVGKTNDFSSSFVISESIVASESQQVDISFEFTSTKYYEMSGCLSKSSSVSGSLDLSKTKSNEMMGLKGSGTKSLEFTSVYGLEEMQTFDGSRGSAQEDSLEHSSRSHTNLMLSGEELRKSYTFVGQTTDFETNVETRESGRLSELIWIETKDTNVRDSGDIIRTLNRTHTWDMLSGSVKLDGAEMSLGSTTDFVKSLGAPEKLSATKSSGTHEFFVMSDLSGAVIRLLSSRSSSIQTRNINDHEVNLSVTDESRESGFLSEATKWYGGKEGEKSSIRDLSTEVGPTSHRFRSEHLNQTSQAIPTTIILSSSLTNRILSHMADGSSQTNSQFVSETQETEDGVLFVESFSSVNDTGGPWGVASGPVQSGADTVTGKEKDNSMKWIRNAALIVLGTVSVFVYTGSVVLEYRWIARKSGYSEFSAYSERREK
jgi:hypothetical protein